MRTIFSGLLLFFATVSFSQAFAAENYQLGNATSKSATMYCRGHCVCGQDGDVIICW